MPDPPLIWRGWGLGFNIGEVYGGLGEPQRALEYYGQALPIRREVGDRAGEAVTRNNVAMIHRAQGGARPGSR